MLKRKDQRIREAQGEKSRQTARFNEIRVFQALMRPLTFSELQRETRLSKPVLSKHLRTLMNDASIYKDTIKRDETTNPEEIGKIVYRANSRMIIPDIVDAIEYTLHLTNPDFDEEAKAEIKRHLEEIAKIAVKQWNRIMVSRRAKLKKQSKNKMEPSTCRTARASLSNGDFSTKDARHARQSRRNNRTSRQ
jgi:DNA-binding transcriptional regulator GbsR (MarR family)